MAIWRSFRSLVNRERLERDLDAELRFHLEQQIDENLRRGLSPSEARRAARIAVGQGDTIREDCQQAWGVRQIDILAHDVRYALRLLRRAPGFTAAAVGIFALGIAAPTTVFAYVDALFLRSLPVDDPAGLIRLYDSAEPDSLSYPNYLDIRDAAQSFSGVAAHVSDSVEMTVSDLSRSIQCELVSGNHFAVFGIRAALGRVFTDTDDLAPGGHPVAVISHRFWQQQFGADVNVVGRGIELNGHPFTIIGVASPGFSGGYPAFPNDVWVTLSMYQQVRPRGIPITHRGWGWLFVTARLRPNITLEAAQAELSILSRRLTAQKLPNLSDGFDLRAVRANVLPESLAGGIRAVLLLLLTLAGLLLVVACANLGGVFLARSITRQREMAICRATGASSQRLLVQMLIECLTLSTLGGAAGVALSIWLARLATAVRPPTIVGYSADPALNPHVAAFAIGASLVSVTIIGAGRSLHMLRADPITGLRLAPGPSSIRGHRFTAADLLVLVQVAVSVLVLVVAGLLVKSVRETEVFDPGFRTERLLVVSFELSRYGYDPPRGQAFFGRLLERVRSLPGTEAVTLTSIVPLGSNRESRAFEIPGYAPPGPDTVVSIAYNIVGPEYFTAMRIPVRQGRAFTDDDYAGRSHVVIVNETMARRFWPPGDAIGKRLGSSGPEIVGIVADSKYYGLGETPRPYVYAPFIRRYAALALSYWYSPSMSLLVRTTGDPGALIAPVRDETRALDPHVTPTDAQPFEELRRMPLFPLRMLALFSSIFGLLSLLLATVGLYGVMAQRVALRRQEMGVRLALGARPSAILRMVIGQGLLLVALGGSVGLAVSLATSGLLRSVLFGVRPGDPATIGVVLGLLLVVSVVACYLPARRATRVNPVEALRAE